MLQIQHPIHRVPECIDNAVETQSNINWNERFPVTQHDLAAEVSVNTSQAYQGKDPKVRGPTKVKVQGEKSVHAYVNLILVVSLQITVACVSVVFRVPLLLLLSAAFLLSGPPGA